MADQDDWVPHATPNQGQTDDWVSHAPASTSGPEPITDYSRSIVAKANDPHPLVSLAHGLEVGLAKPVGNIDRAVAALGSKVGVDTGGAQRYENAQRFMQRPDIAAELNSGWGETGKIAGEVASSLPVAALTENPWAVGAATGAMNTDATSLPGAAVDTATGAVGGKAGQVLARGAGSLISRAVNRFAPNITMDSGPAKPNIARQAAGYVARLMKSSGISPDDLMGVTTQKPVTSAEIIGKSGITALGALARREGATSDALDGLLQERSTNAASRMLDDYASASGIDPALAKGDIDDYVTKGRETVKPMFDQALGGKAGVWNGKLSMLAQRPAVQKAMSAVVEDLKNADVDPTGLGFTGQDPATGKFVQMPRPTAQAWDMVKKRLGSLGERDAFGKLLPDSLSPGNFNLNKANTDLTAALRDAIPGYGAALDASGDYLKMKLAFQNGQDFILNPKVSVQQVAKHFSSLTPQEQQAFKGGIANQLFDKAQNGRLTSGLFYKAQNGALAPVAAVARKLDAALGPKNAQKFLSGIESEGRMAQAGSRMRPGTFSPTAELTAAMKDQDAIGSVPGAVYDFGADMLRGNPVKAVAGAVARGAANTFNARKAIGMPVPVRDEAGRLLMMHPKDLGQYMKGALTQTSPAAQFASRAVPQIENSTVPKVIGATAGAGAGEQLTQQ